MENRLPTFWFPTKTLLIDDDNIYLKNTSYALSSSLNLRKFNSVYTALDEVKSSKFIEADQTYSIADFYSSDSPTLSFDEEKIVGNLLDKNRFDRLTTIICDYSMPEMNGLEFFNQIQGLPVQKILLTGKADISVGIEAFNKGLIDLYIKKDSESVLNILQNIFNLQRKVFINASQFIYNIIQDKLFKNEYVVKKIESLIDKYGAKEFYLLNKSGCYLFVKQNGQCIAFMLYSDSEIDEIIKGFNDYDEFDQQVLSAIEARTHLPFALTESDKNLAPSEWSKAMHKIEKLDGTDNYYYGVIEYTISPFSEPIYSYANYIKDLKSAAPR